MRESRYGSTSTYYEDIDTGDDDDHNHNDHDIKDDDIIDDDIDDDSETSYLLDLNDENSPCLLSYILRCRKSIAQILQSQWNKLQSLLALLIDVDNIWDSPPTSSHYQYTTNIQQTTKHKLVVFFWFLVLASAYALERSSFKIIVDRAGPFRLMSAEVITVTHAVILGLGILLSKLINGQSFQIKSLGIPLANVALMALIDTIHLLFSLLSGSHVSPVLTVIIVQFTIPLTVCMTQCLNRLKQNSLSSASTSLSAYPEDRSQSHYYHNNNSNEVVSNTARGGGVGTAHENNNSSFAHDIHNNNHLDSYYSQDYDENAGTGLTKQHLLGGSIIFIAVMLGVFPAILQIINPSLLSLINININSDNNNITNNDAIMTYERAWNTLVFTLTCIPAAGSTLYKEHTLTHFKQPVDPNILNFILSVFQFVITFLVSPLLFPLQGLGYSSYESPSSFSSNTITTTTMSSSPKISTLEKSYDSWLDVYPSDQVSSNFIDGIQCFSLIGNQLDTDIQTNRYAEPAQCNLAGYWVLLYVMSILLVGISVDKIVHAGATKIMFRGISAGVILAVITMYFYEIQLSSMALSTTNSIGDDDEVGFMNWFYLPCILILIVGSEVYHRVSLPDATFETVYPEVENLYDD